MNEAVAGGDSPSTAIYLAAAALVRFESADGGWAGQVSTHAPLEGLAALCRLPRLESGALDQSAQAVLARLEPDGHLALFPGGPADSGASVLAYALLKLAGLSVTAEPMERLRGHILEAGGIQAADPYTRLILALFQLYPGEHLPALPAQREWRRLPAWARAQLAPLSHLHARHIAAAQPRRTPPDFSLAELVRADRPFSDPRPGVEGGLRNAFSKLAGWLAAPGKQDTPPPLPSDTAALAPTPGLLLTRLAMGQPVPDTCLPSVLPNRDTALALLAHPSPPPKAAAWLRTRTLPGAGWPRQFAAELHSHTEETALALQALRRAQPDEDPPAGALAWLRQLQGRDGGWAACDTGLGIPLRPDLPFPGPFAAADPACPALTGMALEALTACGVPQDDAAVQRGVEFLVRTQLMRDGSWTSRWGVYYMHGTCFALRGLRAAGFDDHDAVVLRAGEWLRSCQNADGGWGESPASLEAGEFIEAPSHPAQTAWALLGLVAGGDAASESVRRGLDFLLGSQGPDGAWESPSTSLMHVPPALFLNNPLDAVVFPMLAIRAVREARS